MYNYIICVIEQNKEVIRGAGGTIASVMGFVMASIQELTEVMRFASATMGFLVGALTLVTMIIRLCRRKKK